MSAFFTSSTTTNFEVRSMATKRSSLPAAVRTSARSIWKKPIRQLSNFFLLGLPPSTSGRD